MAHRVWQGLHLFYTLCPNLKWGMPAAPCGPLMRCNPPTAACALFLCALFLCALFLCARLVDPIPL